MENQDAVNSTKKEDKTHTQCEENEGKLLEEDAGPSQISNLPGSIPIKNPQLKPGLSKSEHSIRQIHTHNDVTLNPTSINFGPQTQTVPSRTTVNSKENVPVAREATKEDAMFIDIKNFMASYFRINRDNQVVVTEVQSIAVSGLATENIQVPSNVRAPTEVREPIVANEVLVGKQAVEPNLSKCSSENKKKNSGSLSERSGFGVAQRDSLSSIGSNVCRICMTRGRERLISPCNCKGSLANVHLTCLERWLNQVGRNHCELCGFSYPAIRTPRYTVLQALRLWFGNPRNRSHLQSDCLIFWLLSTVTAGLLAVCIVGTQYFVIEGKKIGKTHEIGGKDEGISHRITETAMDFFMAIVLCGYFVTVYLLCKDHYVMWNRWRRANVHVRLLLSADTDPVPFVPRAYTNV